MAPIPCDFCGNDIPLSRERCPHCALPGLFPNVRAAQDPAERGALDSRYLAACRDAESRGVRKTVEDFEKATADSKAVIARPLRELDRLASADEEMISTFYNQLRAEMRLPHGNKWDGLRGIADEALFPGYREHIRFAALSLDGAGLPHYGDCSLVLRESMIAHRASVYEENSAISMMKHGYEPPAGYRAPWNDRARLCVAKTAGEVDATTNPDQFPRLLLSAGATPEEDRFVEVHIWGPMTFRTVERVLVPPQKGKAIRKNLRGRLRAVGVSLEDLP